MGTHHLPHSYSHTYPIITVCKHKIPTKKLLVFRSTKTQIRLSKLSNNCCNLVRLPSSRGSGPLKLFVAILLQNKTNRIIHVSFTSSEENYAMGLQYMSIRKELQYM